MGKIVLLTFDGKKSLSNLNILVPEYCGCD